MLCIANGCRSIDIDHRHRLPPLAINHFPLDAYHPIHLYHEFIGYGFNMVPVDIAMQEEAPSIETAEMPLRQKTPMKTAAYLRRGLRK